MLGHMQLNRFIFGLWILLNGTCLNTCKHTMPLQKQPEFAGKQVDFQRRDAAIMVNWRLVARVSCASRDSHELLMLREGMEAASIVPAGLLVQFKIALREAGIGEGASNLRWESCV